MNLSFLLICILNILLVCKIIIIVLHIICFYKYKRCVLWCIFLYTILKYFIFFQNMMLWEVYLIILIKKQVRLSQHVSLQEEPGFSSLKLSKNYTFQMSWSLKTFSHLGLRSPKLCLMGLTSLTPQWFSNRKANRCHFILF